MSNYSTSISKRYSTKGECTYRVHYSYISPVDGKRHRSTKGGFKRYGDAIHWLRFGYHKFLRERERAISHTIEKGAVI